MKIYTIQDFIYMYYGVIQKYLIKKAYFSHNFFVYVFQRSLFVSLGIVWRPVSQSVLSKQFSGKCMAFISVFRHKIVQIQPQSPQNALGRINSYCPSFSAFFSTFSTAFSSSMMSDSMPRKTVATSCLIFNIACSTFTSFTF